jgi:hypothetical protein
MNKKENSTKIMEDYIFKLIFGKISSKKLLSDFFERILGKKVEIELILNSEITRELFIGKSISLDVVLKPKKMF